MLWETFQKLAPLPAFTPQQRELVAAFFDIDQDITELAAALNQDLFDTVTQLQDPAVAPWIAALITLKNNERRERALRTLDAALTNEHNPSTIRRAATRILRHYELSRPPRASINRAIDVGGCFEPPTSMRTTRDLHTNDAPRSTTQQGIEKSPPPTPNLSEPWSEGPGRSIVPLTCTHVRADLKTTPIIFTIKPPSNEQHVASSQRLKSLQPTPLTNCASTTRRRSAPEDHPP